MKSGYSGNKYSGYSGPGSSFYVTYNSVAEANAAINRVYRYDGSTQHVSILNEDGEIELYHWRGGTDDKNLVKIDFKTEAVKLINKFSKKQLSQEKKDKIYEAIVNALK